MSNGVMLLTDELQWGCYLAQQAGEPHVDLATLLGVPGGPRVSVENITSVLAAHEHPVVALSWDDHNLTLRGTDGGLLATFEIVF